MLDLWEEVLSEQIELSYWESRMDEAEAYDHEMAMLGYEGYY